jgi:hypothetical protein
MQPPPTRQISYATAVAGLQHLQQAEFVYVRKGAVGPPLSPTYQSPYRVLDRREKFFKLEVGGRPEVVSVDRLKPQLGTAPVMAASSPQPGCPKGPGQWRPPIQPFRPPLGGWPPWRMKSTNRGEQNSAIIWVAYVSLFLDLCASLLLMLSK